MEPILITFAGIHLYSISIGLVVSWLVFSFIFWRILRNHGTAEERIFELTFYSTIAAFVTARTAFVLTHVELFRGDILRIAAIWVVPGMSLLGALLGGLGTLAYLSRLFKIRVGHVLDAVGFAFGVAYLLGLIGAFLDGAYVGLPATVPWAVRYAGHVGLRHPVHLYELAGMILILSILKIFSKNAVTHKWPYGILGLWFFAMFAASQFVLEFFKDTPVYLAHLRANQWVLVALFAETMGVFYVRGGGREAVRPFINKVIGGIHGKFSKRSA